MMKESNSGKSKNRCLLWLLAWAMTMAVTGCGSSESDSSKSEAAYDTGAYVSDGYAYAAETEAYAYDMADEAAAEEGYAETAETEEGNAVLEDGVQTTERKLIKTVDLVVETENYDSLMENLDKQTAGFGGYVEYRYQYNGSSYSGYEEIRTAILKIRIPVEKLDTFVVKVGEVSNITNKTEQVEDVTLQYVDLESRKKALMTEQERLLELLAQAESVEDIIAIEQRLSEVRYELESMESQLRMLDNQVDYSTVNLTVQEVKRLTPTEEKSVWDKMQNGFIKTLYQIGNDIEYGFIWFVANIPYMIIWIVIILIILLVFRAFVKRRKRKKEAALKVAEKQMDTELSEAMQDPEEIQIQKKEEERNENGTGSV